MPLHLNEERERLELREDEVQDIISRPPGMLVRWGLTALFLIFLLLMGLSWLIQYPDLIKAKVVVTTDPAPINIVSRAAGKILLWKVDNSKVKAGEIIASIKSNANIKDVLLVDSLLQLPDRTLQTSSLMLSLGDLQEGFSRWELAKQNLNLFYQNQIEDKQIQHLQKQITGHRKLALSLQEQLKITHEENLLAKAKFKTDSILYHQKVTSSLDINKAKSEFLGQQRSTKNSEMLVINNELQISALEKQISELQANRFENQNKLVLDMTHAKNELAAQILKWRDTYLFISPVDGVVNYLDFLEQNEFVGLDKPIFTVVSASKEIIGRAELPILGSGKVKDGQKVNIRLDNFPFEQYGMLSGTVKEISAIPAEDKYLVKIDLADTLLTSFNNRLSFRQQMKGETEIITEDQRLIERIFYSIIKAVKTR